MQNLENVQKLKNIQSVQNAKNVQNVKIVQNVQNVQNVTKCTKYNKIIIPQYTGNLYMSYKARTTSTLAVTKQIMKSMHNQLQTSMKQLVPSVVLSDPIFRLNKPRLISSRFELNHADKYS